VIYILPLEPLEERYTEQWWRWFQAWLKSHNVEHCFIPGEALTTSVESGKVLDIEGTNYWKATQLAAVCRLFKNGYGRVKDGDKFFTMDLWHPGLEAIKYMAVLENIDVEIYGFLHAGSYTTEDFAAPMAPWAQHFEAGWITMCDKVFVGSQYHKDKIIATRASSASMIEDWEEKIIVTGCPLTLAGEGAGNWVLTPVAGREKIIIFPHRWDYEKRPGVFVDMMNELWERRQDFHVLITSSRRKQERPELGRARFPYVVQESITKAMYYHWLSMSRVFVSTTIEENFGLCLCEASILGCHPVVPNAFSHPEILRNDPKFLYTAGSIDSALIKINAALDNPVSAARYIESYGRSLDKIMSEMGVCD
jgi:glycosyltransferase involved in cell wall biosynthesis